MIIHFISSSDDYFTINDLDYLMKEINNIMKNNVELKSKIKDIRITL